MADKKSKNQKIKKISLAVAGGVASNLLIEQLDKLLPADKPELSPLAGMLVGFALAEFVPDMEPLGYGILAASAAELTEDLKDKLASNGGLSGLLGLNGQVSRVAPANGVMDFDYDYSENIDD